MRVGRVRRRRQHELIDADALEFCQRVQSGSALVNMPPSFRADHMPYGGVKDSGQGREGVKYAVAELVREKLVILKP